MRAYEAFEGHGCELRVVRRFELAVVSLACMKMRDEGSRAASSLKDGGGGRRRSCGSVLTVSAGALRRQGSETPGRSTSSALLLRLHRAHRGRDRGSAASRPQTCADAKARTAACRRRQWPGSRNGRGRGRGPGHHWWRRAHAPLATPRTSPPKEPPSSLGPAQEAGEPLALERSRRGPVRRRLRGSGGIGDVAQLSPSRLSAGARPGRRAALCRARFWCRHLEPVLDCGMAHVWLVFSSPTALHSISAELVAGSSYASSVPKQNMKELLIICLLHPPPPFSDTNRRYSYRVAVHLAGKPFI